MCEANTYPSHTRSGDVICRRWPTRTHKAGCEPHGKCASGEYSYTSQSGKKCCRKRPHYKATTLARMTKKSPSMRPTRSTRSTRSTNPWIKHVQEFWDFHPHLSYKEALQKARASYH